jgi:hypothetical protein
MPKHNRKLMDLMDAQNNNRSDETLQSPAQPIKPFLKVNQQKIHYITLYHMHSHLFVYGTDVNRKVCPCPVRTKSKKDKWLHIHQETCPSTTL